MLAPVFLASLLAGLLLGVRAMLVGVERPAAGADRTRTALSMPAIAAAATAFGLTGYLLVHYAALGPVPALLAAMALAVAAAAGMVALVTRVAAAGVVDPHDDPRYRLQGTPARVTRAMCGDVDGEVAYDAAGAQYATLARSFDGSALQVGDEVVIDHIEDGVAYVEAWAVVEKRI